MDINDLSPFQDVPGLLTPEQSNNAKAMGLLNAGASLLKSGGSFHPYKGGWGADIGSGVQGLLTGYTQGTDQALKQQLLRQQIMSGQLGMAQTVALYRALGLPLPNIPGMTAGSGNVSIPAAPGVASAAPAGGPPAAGGGNPPPGLMSPAPAGPAVDNGGPGVVVPTPDGSSFTRVPAPQPSGAPSAVGTVQGLPIADRAVLATGGPAAVAKVVGEVAAKNAEQTPEQKNARASGFPTPFAYLTGVDNAKETPEQKNARASGANGNPLQFEYDKAQVPVRVKQFGDIQEQGTKALDTKGNIALVQQTLTDPTFYSGPGEERVLKLKQGYAAYARWLNGKTGAQPGDKNYRDPSGAASMENFSAVTKELLGNELRTNFAGQRITNKDVRIYEQAVPTSDNTPEGNLVRSMIIDKAQQRKLDVADLATNYANDHGGHLDAGWDAHLRSWWQKNPLFVDGELQAMKAEAAQRIGAARAAGQPTSFNSRFTGDPNATPQGGPAAPPAAGSPPASVLKSGIVTTFKNGQRWTLGADGQPAQVQ